MTRDIVWRPDAQADLLALYDWIAGQADHNIAFGYTAGIEDYAATLATFSERGTIRDDLAVGIRTVVYRRRTTIAYRVLPRQVEIVRLAHAGRDMGRMFADEGE